MEDFIVPVKKSFLRIYQWPLSGRDGMDGHPRRILIQVSVVLDEPPLALFFA
jgi:hypothetical protein